MINFKNSKLEKLINFIRKSDNKLTEDDREKIIKLIKPAIGISTIKMEADNLKIGGSKIGGKPDLPKDVPWPRLNGNDLVFFAQYNILELKKFDVENLLPEKGMFYIFIGIGGEWNGFSMEQKDCKIFLIENLEDLERKEYPPTLNLEGKVEPAQILYFESLTIPDDENYKLIEFDEKYEDFYFHFYQYTADYIEEEINDFENNMHQLLGEDRSVQSSIVYEFSRIELKISDEDYSEKWTEVLENSKTFSNLIQLDCHDSNTNLSKFGGSGVFYIGLKTNELEKKDFKNLMISFQTT
ncbi:MAG TPA: DUF1963 domain-containing protein [Saprospiraceae bacterium]|nr:DUF1963 domain-containing protein [Saprospiraceae bacterium]HPN69617.1 DUF1963 domain-containing protein [Saprospiraceae bacterium]